MMKKALLVLILFLLVGCGSKDVITPVDDCDDSHGCELGLPSDVDVQEKILDFEDSYEALNGKNNSKGTPYRVIDIEENDIFKLFDLSLLDEVNTDWKDWKFTGILLISDPKCPWCRSVLPTAVQVAKELNIEDVYVINAWDDTGNEIFRDKYIEVKDGYEYQEGHPLYAKLIGLDGNNILDDYDLKLEDGTKIDVGEKRLYLPSFLYIKDNKIIAFTTGISDKQENGNDELTDAIVKDMKTQLTKFFKATQE